jgi:nucleoside-diphosphate-sugar epimerase
LREALIFGASGQIGRPLLDRLVHAGWRVSAVSREAQAAAPGVIWLRGDLQAPPALPSRVDAVFSCGPLDAFARWYAHSGIEARRVIAFGSTSVETKSSSDDPHERDVASRLREAERLVIDRARVRSAAATLLRPTLVYGAGRDATLTRIAQLARRWGWFALPRNADGLRQPVHVDDLANAAVACLQAEATHGRAYALPGGEALRYDEMVARVLGALEPRPRLVRLPGPVFRAALGLARMTGRASGLGDAAIRRMRTDLVFDAGPAQRDFGYAPRRFVPTAAMFEVP